MQTNNNSTELIIIIGPDDRLSSFRFTKNICGKNVSDSQDYENLCKSHTLHNIFHFSFEHVCDKLSVFSEEDQFILFLEWDALRTGIGKYLGIETEGIDKDRCLIESIEEHIDGTEVSMVLLPPKGLPDIDM